MKSKNIEEKLQKIISECMKDEGINADIEVVRAEDFLNKIKPYSRFKQGVEEKLKTEEGILEVAQIANELSCNVLIENNGEKTRQEVEGNTFTLLLDLAFLIGDMIKKSGLDEKLLLDYVNYFIKKGRK